MPRLLLLAALLLLASCKRVDPVVRAPVAAAAPAAPVPAPVPPGIDVEALDPGVSPCEDFYQYACGGWLQRTELPEGQLAWSRGFDAVAEGNAEALRALLEEAARGEGGREALGAFWAACMDEPALEEGLEGLEAALAPLEGLRHARQLGPVLGTLHARGLPGFFTLGPALDAPSEEERVAAALEPDGLGLPDRDAYLSAQASLVAVRRGYEDHLRRVFLMLGDAPRRAASHAHRVLQLETALARATPPRRVLQGSERPSTPLDRRALEAAASGFDWEAYLAALGATHVHTLSVTHPPFFVALARLARRTPPDVLRSYLRWHAVRSLLPALPRRLREEASRFTAVHVSASAPEAGELPRWRQCVALADASLGPVLGQAFAERALDAEGQRRTRQLSESLARALAQAVDAAAWMDGPTREAARAKAKGLKLLVAAPASGLAPAPALDPGSFLYTLLATRRAAVAGGLSRIGQPETQDAWPLTPVTADAAYVPARNALLLPAGLLRPPFFQPAALEAVNYGALGMVVGHELTHAVDTGGRRFDARGRPEGWGTAAAAEAFSARAACVRRQLHGAPAGEGVTVDGERTLGESVADLGGLQLAWEALRSAHPEGAHDAGGPWRFTPAQSFFLGFAQAWCGKAHPTEARVRALSAPSAPPALRVNGPLRNLPAFQEAFQCRAGQGMVRPAAERCAVW